MSDKIRLGNWGETLVAKSVDCPKCKNSNTLKKLVQNFRCADLICDFCGFIAQVKTTKVPKVDTVPDTILGAAWAPQKARMDAGIYTSLFLVLKSKVDQNYAIHFLPAELQTRSMFVPRSPLSENAQRAGWQGFLIDTRKISDRFVKVAEGTSRHS